MARGRLLLVRHGESQGNAERRFTGSRHVPLTKLGRDQGRQAAVFLRQFYAPVRLVSSPFHRALETAQLIGRHLELPIEIEQDVREQHLGRLHGKPYEAAEKTPGYGVVPRWEWRPPSGETLIEVQSRAVPAVGRIAGEHAGADVVIVSHAGTIAAIWAHTLGAWDNLTPVPNTAVLVVHYDEGHLGDAELIVPDEA
jgi:probable phosphoglycerate mutase